MKSVLISIHPKWCDLTASGNKTIEVRKTRPKLETPFKCYIYCTMGDVIRFQGRRTKATKVTFWMGKAMNHESPGRYTGNGAVIGEFVCDGVYENISCDCEGSCVSASELREYANGKSLYGWHISDLKIYDKPKELSEFGRGCDAEHINEIHCRDCKKLVSFGDCCEVMCKPLNRPPQSWCYVEELQ